MCLHYIGNEIVSSPHREKRRLKLDSGAYSVSPIFFSFAKRYSTAAVDFCGNAYGEASLFFFHYFLTTVL
jgi:hypothetical protein